MPTNRIGSPSSSSNPYHASREPEKASQPARVSSSVTPTPVDGTRVVLVGGGPRGASQVVAELQFLMEHKQDFEALQAKGGKYNIETVLIHEGDEDSIGRGNAWGEEQGGGTVNTGAEGGKGGMDYRNRLIEFFTANREPLMEDYRKTYPVAAATFKSALDGTEGAPGILVTSRGIATRREQGREELENFRRMREEVLPLFPFYKLEVKTGTQATAVDITNPAKPVVTFRRGTHIKNLQADTVRLNTGTTLASPIRDEAVQRHAFTQAMHPEKLNTFLKDKGLLDDQGQLKQGTKLALGGSGLSAYDQVIALHPSMDLFELDENAPIGYKITDSAKKKYQGAITFISNTAGKWIPPRHAHSPAWTQNTAPFGTENELQALFLHKQGQEVYDSWQHITDATVAIATDRVPSQVRQKGLSTEELLRQQHKSTVQHAERILAAKFLNGDAKQQMLRKATHTLEGARRQAHFAAVLGLPLAEDLGAAVKKVGEGTPLTYKGIAGYMMIRGQLNAISEPGTEVSKNNAALLAVFEERAADLTSSPFRVHDMVPQLMESGIATYMAGSYSDLKENKDEGRALSFTSKDKTPAQFDAFIVSPTFNRGKEPTIASLAGQIKPVHPAIPNLPQVGKHRRILAESGELSNVEDHGLNGKGANIPGTRSKVGIFAYDVNNKESATEVAPSLAYRRMAQVHLAAVGSPNPVEEVENLYKKHIPSDADYINEVGRFEPHFDSAIDKALFAQAVESTAGDNKDTYQALIEKGRTPAGRKEVLDAYRAIAGKDLDNPTTRQQALSAAGPIMEKNLNDPERFEAYVRSMKTYESAQRQKFKPASNEEYQNRFVDSPLHVHEAVYREAFNIALGRAEQRIASQSNKRAFITGSGGQPSVGDERSGKRARTPELT